jgi:hypothetical protein
LGQITITMPGRLVLSPKSIPKDHDSIVRHGPPATPPSLAAHPFSTMVAQMPFDKLSDHYILHMYESIRDEAHADARPGIRLMGEPAKARAEELRLEIERRGLYCPPIEWPVETATTGR